jgi:hypothetical protein
MSTISSGTTLTTAIQIIGDTTGNLAISTGSANTVAMTIDNSQNVSFANAVTYNGTVVFSGGLTGNGAGLTSLNGSNVTSGTIATARLATGTANSSTYLRGDQTWAAVPAATPGGSTTQVQFNNAGAFGGDSGFVYSSGNVGIGTASPTTRLHVAGSVGAYSLTNSDTIANQLYMQNTAGNKAANFQIGTTGILQTWVYGGSSWVNATTIDSSGNLGVGTTSPSSGGKLAVYGKVTYAGQNQVALFYSQTSGGAVVNFQDTSSTSGTAVGGVGDNLTFYSSSGGGNLTERMRIDTSGRVGIGTASPSSLLDVNTSAAGNFVARITNNSGASSSDHALLVETSTASSAKIISARNAGVERFVVTGSGDVIVNNTFQFNSGYGSAATAYGCRAWVKFSGSSGSINGSGNVSSVSDNGTGNFTVNFSSGMPDTNYAWNGTADPTSGQTSDGAVKCVFGRPDTNPTTSAIALLTCSSGFGRDDFESVFVTVHR